MAALHRRPEVTNMRSAYDHKRSRDSANTSGSDSLRSASDSQSSSNPSYHTQPTDCSWSSHAKRPAQIHYDSIPAHAPVEPIQKPFFDDRPQLESPRGSVDTYASTQPDEEELEEEPLEYTHREYDTVDSYSPSAIPATPSDFSELFPSKRRLAIRHDDSTPDGNMNLRIDTEVSINGQRRDMTLFHMRLQDLRSREYSLRRYCRDSGREVCHTATKQPKPLRPGFQRSVSNALNSMRSKSDQKTRTLGRNDSGYGSMHSLDGDHEQRPVSSSAANSKSPQPTSFKLEFSNYAQVDIKRTGVQANKRYEFEYWGTTYTWRRIVRKDSWGPKQIAYHLTKSNSDAILASISPEALTPAQMADEHRKGGWIPPSTLQITDEILIKSQKDVSDVIVASGLTALVDDCIRVRFHSPDARQLLIPVPKLQMGVEYIGPKRLINEMFGRRDSSSASQPPGPPSSGRRQSDTPRVAGASGSAVTSSQRPTTATRRQASCAY